jgi:hypothetical protein
MAQVVQVLNVAHTPFCYQTPEQWEQRRRVRPIRADVPVDPPEVNEAKHRRIQNAFGTLREKLAAVRPDVLVIFGDDQKECFDFDNFPSFAVYVGDEFAGYRATRDAMARPPGGGEPEKNPHTWATLKGHPGLAVDVLTGIMQRGFDPAFSMELPNLEKGMGHAFMRPAESLTDMNIPVVPILVNCYYAPQPTAMRCYQLGHAVREAIEQSPLDLRVAVIGSGGMWHTPGMPDAYLDEDFDRSILDAFQAGDPKQAAERFDSYQIPEGDRSQDHSRPGKEITGMPGFGGPQGGIRETCNHIAASGAAGNRPGTLIDYVPVYASPIGAAFMVWESV